MHQRRTALFPVPDPHLCHLTEPRPQDAQDKASNENVVKVAAEQLGSLDIVIANAGWTNFGDFSDLSALSEDEWDKCWAINVRAPMTLMKASKPHFDKNTEGGVFLITSSIAAKTIGGSSMAYCVTKAAQVHLMKCMAKTQGQKIRCNAVLPGLLLTEWVCLTCAESSMFPFFAVEVLPHELTVCFKQGLKYGDEAIKHRQNAAALKHETYLEDCVEVYIMLAKNTSFTGQAVQVDAGLKIDNM